MSEGNGAEQTSNINSDLAFYSGSHQVSNLLGLMAGRCQGVLSPRRLVFDGRRIVRALHLVTQSLDLILHGSADHAQEDGCGYRRGHVGLSAARDMGRHNLFLSGVKIRAGQNLDQPGTWRK
jgi:hypothetical protein